MELFERRRYYFCHHCGTFHFLEVAAVEGLQVVDRQDRARSCPVCTTPLSLALLNTNHSVDHCERCGGFLMVRPTFADVVQRRRASASGPAAPPVPIDRRELERRLNCPACRSHMEVHPYYGPGNVVIDTCDRCDMVWMDGGELQQIEDAPGADRGPHRRR